MNWKVGTNHRGAETCEQDEEHELMIDSGCYGHVCPPWFAPQFCWVSSSNVEAVAANNEALQHNGQKVVYGHVTTNSGRRVLIQITFDVMSVHDCYSYLCLTLANGIPHRKAMVMAGENVSNDVDEEVYVGDGVTGQEAHEASAGDRRAIADADQAGQLDISGETRAARALRTPKPQQTLQG